MHIDAQINEFKSYVATFARRALSTYTLTDIESGMALNDNNFLLQMDTSTYAVSQWTGPKRSRTYPYPRVYDTIHHQPRVTLIPFVKDEGKDGDRDYLQWDTISLMSLLGVYVIITYHTLAERSTLRGAADKEKITNHQLDTAYVTARLHELASYQSDAVHWNRREIKDYMPDVVNKAIENYQRIATETGVTLHSIAGIRQRYEQLGDFEQNSRERARQAQAREQSFTHQAERLVTEDKATITIQNFYNGMYFFTVDEVVGMQDTLYLIEKKHTSGKLPSANDIKDALLKNILYCQLDETYIADKSYQPVSIIGLTARNIKGFCHSAMSAAELDAFFQQNPQLSKTNTYRNRVDTLFAEARQNNFGVYIVQDSTESLHREAILKALAQ